MRWVSGNRRHVIAAAALLTATAIAAALCVLLVPGEARTGALGVVLAISIVVSFAVQLAFGERVGFVDRLSFSAFAALVIVVLAAVIGLLA